MKETQHKLHDWALQKLWLASVCHYSHSPRSLRTMGKPSCLVWFLCMWNLNSVWVSHCILFPQQHLLRCTVQLLIKLETDFPFLHNLHMQHIMTSRTVARTEHWHKGYRHTEMWNKSWCDFLFSGKKERVGRATNPRLPDQISACSSASFSRDWAQRELLEGGWEQHHISEHRGWYKEIICISLKPTLPSKALTLRKCRRKQFARGLFAVTLVKCKPKKRQPT